MKPIFVTYAALGARMWLSGVCDGYVNEISKRGIRKREHIYRGICVRRGAMVVRRLSQRRLLLL